MSEVTPYKHWFFRHPVHAEIAQDRYYLKGPTGEPVETDISEVFVRVVAYLTGYRFTIERSEEIGWVIAHPIATPNGVTAPMRRAMDLLRNMLDRRLMGGGRILAQAGTRVQNLNNCFVLGSGDTREEISALMHQHLLIQSGGGGTGIDASVWRPRWSWVAGNQSRSCGAIGWISLISQQASLVQQGGNRSGANMGKLDDWHPDLLDFINWKTDHNWIQQFKQFANIYDQEGYKLFEWGNAYEWQYFNVSVGLSDKFMGLLKDAPDTEWEFNWQGTPWKVWKYKAYGRDWEVTAVDEAMAEGKVLSQLPFNNKPPDFKLVKANYNLTVAQLWHRIAKNAHDDGCPGIIFIDRIRKYHNGEYFNPIVSTNPCGEQPLPKNGVCCLGGVNIYYCLNEDGTVNEDLFREAIQYGVYMLNLVTDVTRTGIPEIDASVLNERRIGLGVTGWHDALIRNKLKYSSPEGRAWVRQWVKFLRDESYRASIELAKTDGAFPAFDFEGYSKSEFFKSLPEDIQQDIKVYGVRNVTVNTIPPFGTTGTIWGTSASCEPHFAGMFTRNSRVGSYRDGCFDYIEYVEKHGEKNTPDYFEWSHDISWKDHLLMQDVFAEYIDSSVSKTINLPRSATVADVKRAYEYAYELGHIKSTTVYVDGSKQQILETLDGTSNPASSIRPQKIVRHDAPKRPDVLRCDIHHTTVKGKVWVVMVGMLHDQPYEVFAGKQTKVELDDSYTSGSIVKVASNKYMLETNGTRMNIQEVFENDEQAAMTRMISTNLRHGADIAFIVDQLQKSGDSIVDFSKAIARVLKKYVKAQTKSRISRKCPNCGSPKVDVITRAGCEVYLCETCGQENTKCD
jgi:adenosylcobalamin-dependent ribonucleoside-diphosphate reductase